MGAEVTNVSLHAGGMLVGLRSIPLGAKDISDDIACAFGIQRRDAERLKCFYGSAMTSPRDNHEMIDAAPIGAEDGAEPTRITRAQLMTVIRQQVEGLTSQIDEALKSLGFTGPVGRQVVLTGGGASGDPRRSRACPKRIAARPSRLWLASRCSPGRAAATSATSPSPECARPRRRAASWGECWRH
jgi:cell division ATPase FtsA